MNIVDLLFKNDSNIQVQAWNITTNAWTDVKETKPLFKKIIYKPRLFDYLKSGSHDSIIRGLILRSDMRIVVKNAANFWPNFTRGEGNFIFQSLGGRKANILIGWGRDSLSEYEKIRAKQMPKTRSVQARKGDTPNLIIEVPSQKGAKLFLGIHRLLDRKKLYQLCTGNGVEIGPGLNPQIKSSDKVNVKYIEQATPDEWEKLYGIDAKKNVDPKLWNDYVIGNANCIPVESNSQDFIFSSHLVEHLANPLGHLEYWGTLLKKGGVIVAIIPDKSGCKDYVFEESSFEEIEEEYKSHSTEPTLAHYQRWSQYRMPHSNALDLMEAGRSIHVHFYTPNSMQEILKKMSKNIGFSDYSIISEHNHKDFFVILRK